mgnify:CR=1 FL=1
MVNLFYVLEMSVTIFLILHHLNMTCEVWVYVQLLTTKSKYTICMWKSTVKLAANAVTNISLQNILVMMTIEYSLDLKVVLFRHFKKSRLYFHVGKRLLIVLIMYEHFTQFMSGRIDHRYILFSFFLHSLIPFMYNSYTSMFRLIKLNRVLGAINPTTTYFTGTVAIKHL